MYTNYTKYILTYKFDIIDEAGEPAEDVKGFTKTMPVRTVE